MDLDIFDALFNEVERYATTRNNTLLTLSVPKDQHPFRVGPGVSQGIILRSETFAEFGNASTASSGFTLTTNNVSFVQDNRVRLIGPDICELQQGSILPFGCVLMAAGQSFTASSAEHLAECQYVTDWVEGWMVRSRPGSVWGRVSREAVKHGFDFAFLGAALIWIVRKKLSHVEAVEVLFVTSSDDDVHALDAIGKRARSLTHDLNRENWMEKGIDIDCPYGGHCGACSEKETCDEVRKVAALREAMRQKSDRST